jgi:hypothetical protein
VISGPVSFPLIMMFLAVVLILRNGALRNSQRRSPRAVSGKLALPERPGVDGYQLHDPLKP